MDVLTLQHYTAEDETQQTSLAEKIRHHRDNFHVLDGQRGHLKKLMKEAVQLPYAITFWHLARQFLPVQVFQRIDYETRLLMGRGIMGRPVKARSSEILEEKE